MGWQQGATYGGAGALLGAKFGGPWGAGVGGGLGFLYGLTQGGGGDQMSEEDVERVRQESLGYYQGPQANLGGIINKIREGPQTKVAPWGTYLEDKTMSGKQMLGLGRMERDLDGPSIAAQQYQAALAQQRNQAMSAISGVRGGGRGAAAMNVASQFGANAGINAAQQAAAVSQERQDRLKNYTDAVVKARAQAQSRIGLGLQATGMKIGQENAWMGHDLEASRQGINLAGNQANTSMGFSAQAQNAAHQQQMVDAANRQGWLDTAATGLMLYGALK